MSRDHYELKDALGVTTRIACAVAEEHGATWHDHETKKYRDVVSKDSPKESWLVAAMMEYGRTVEVAPIMASLKAGYNYPLPKEYRLIETGGTLNDSVVVHGAVAEADYGVVSPSEFGEWIFSVRDKIQALGFMGEMATLSRLGANGNRLIGDVLLGKVDFGAGDTGEYYAQFSTGYDSDPTTLMCTINRRVCANTDQAAREEANRTGRQVNVSLKNRGENKLAKLAEMTDESLGVFAGWIKEYEERMKFLKSVKLPATPDTMKMLKLTGLQSGVLKPKKDKETGSIPMPEDIMATLVSGGSDAREVASGDYGKLGAEYFASLTQTRLESTMGIEDIIDTAYGYYQTATRLATRKGDGVNSHPGLLQWARGIEKAAIGMK